MLSAVLSLFLGFVLLIKGADFFVDGSSSVAQQLKVPSLIIGLTIVAMGTSLPELSVSITASLANSNALAVSNVIGSNLFNLMVVLGASAVLAPMPVSPDVMRKDFPFSVACALLLLVLGSWGMELTRLDGLIFLLVFGAFLVYQVLSALKARKAALEDPEEREKVLPLGLSLLFILGGAVAVKFGGDGVVYGARTVAAAFGMSENLIGLTIVAMGTSLPELVTSLVAARKKELDVAVGNVVGSNIFNILAILGVASAVSPITFIAENVIDILILMGFSALVWFFCLTKKRLDRWEGLAMVSLYACYTLYICLR